MSLSLVRPYFVARCKAAGLSHEHKDAFNEDNISSTLINNSFHVQVGSVSGIKLNQTDQELSCSVTVKFWLKGYRNPVDAVDAGVLKSETLLKECLKHSNRLGQCLKNVVLISVSYEPLSDSNDNVVEVSLGFTALTSILIT